MAFFGSFFDKYFGPVTTYETSKKTVLVFIPGEFRKKLLLFLFILIPFLLPAENSSFPFSFLELENLATEKGKHRKVTMRGFLYQTKDNQWILSSEPHLKSCCIGSIHKATQQIYVDFDSLNFAPYSKQAITIEGEFFWDYILNESENKVPHYYLKKARIKEAAPLNSYWFYIFIGIAFLVILFYLGRKARRSL